MSDIIIFGIGCFVSLMVAGAVGLLLWGASNEPSGNLVTGTDSGAPGSPASKGPATARDVGSREQLAGRGA